ncbi:unnamed protein product [Amoebophrya sp. A25]|nr:unnamed protein product [Amoebophrya sp. A25]|eukprot:GSA25T00005817001.1
MYQDVEDEPPHMWRLRGSPELGGTGIVQPGAITDPDLAYFHVFSLEPRELALLTFDLRHLSLRMRYGRDWQIRVFVDKADADPPLSPLHIDPLDCAFIVSDRASAGKYPFRATTNARERGCRALEVPNSYPRSLYSNGFVEAITRPRSLHLDSYFIMYPDPVLLRNTAFTLNLYAEMAIHFKVEVQILNGLFVADRLMFERSCVVEIVSPQRAAVGTHKAFVAEIAQALRVELPYNMPLSTVKVEDEEKTPETIQWAFLNWSPVIFSTFYRGLMFGSNADASALEMSIPLHVEMRLPSTDNEFVFMQKKTYFGGREMVTFGHLPYWSNCRGFGRTAPLWAILEQGTSCRWEETYGT